MEALSLPINMLDHALDLPTPKYATADSAGLDLLAAIDDSLTLAPGERSLISTGLTMALPEGYEAQIRSRSGLSAKHGVVVLNSPGTIDADYRGEVKVILMNHGNAAYTIQRGDKIAQMVIARYSRVRLCPVQALPETDRGAGGFGSTGTTGL